MTKSILTRLILGGCETKQGNIYKVFYTTKQNKFKLNM